MDGRRFVHADDAEGLQPLGPDGGFAYDSRAFVSGLESVAAQDGDVQQHVGAAAVLGDEAVALGRVEPFDATGDLDELQAVTRVVGGLDIAV